MIKRVSKILQVGPFRNATSGGKATFDKLSVVFGFNTHGKSTLSGIFRSISRNDPELIVTRKSIPANAAVGDQLIEISHNVTKDGKETKFTFTSGVGWDPNPLTSNLFVFDADFIHRNILSGTQVTRENKENLTDFVLGEDGVNLSNEIEADKKRLRERKNDLKNLRPQYVASATDPEVVAFLGLTVTSTNSSLLKEREGHETEIKILKEAGAITALPDVSIPLQNVEKRLMSAISEINTEMESSHENVTAGTIERIEAHVKLHNFDGNAHPWLAKGVEYKEKNSCAFCSQPLNTEPAKTLIEAYGDFFSKEYREFTQGMITHIQEALRNLQGFQISHAQIFRTVTLSITQAIRLIPETEGPVKEVQEKIVILETTQNALIVAVSDFVKSIELAVLNKQAKPHEKMDPITMPAAVSKALEEFSRAHGEVTDSLAKVVSVIGKRKAQFIGKTPALIRAQEQQEKNSIAQIEREIARLDQSKECGVYLRAIEDIKVLEELIAVKTVKLEADQSAYLERFFDDLNKVFEDLGCSDFKLDRRPTQRGDKKVYELGLKYKGTEIPPEKIYHVLSESDKRGLALAIFITKIIHLPEPEKAIVVLDDPLVSFDDNRIDMLVLKIVELSEKVRQIIVLTHYISLIRKLKEKKAPATYLLVRKDTDSSIIETLDPKNFTLLPLELSFEKIYDYLQGKNCPEVIIESRVYMENMLKFLYMKEMKENGISAGDTLGTLIKNLASGGVIDEATRVELQSLNGQLAPEHHILRDGSADPASMKAVIKKTFEFLHNL